MREERASLLHNLHHCNLSLRFFLETSDSLKKNTHMIHQKKPKIFPNFRPCHSLPPSSLSIPPTAPSTRGTGISSPFDTSSNSSKESSPVELANGCSSLEDSFSVELKRPVSFWVVQNYEKVGEEPCFFWGLKQKMIQRLSRGAWGSR